MATNPLGEVHAVHQTDGSPQFDTIDVEGSLPYLSLFLHRHVPATTVQDCSSAHHFMLANVHPRSRMLSRREYTETIHHIADCPKEALVDAEPSLFLYCVDFAGVVSGSSLRPLGEGGEYTPFARHLTLQDVQKLLWVIDHRYTTKFPPNLDKNNALQLLGWAYNYMRQMDRTELHRALENELGQHTPGGCPYRLVGEKVFQTMGDVEQMDRLQVLFQQVSPIRGSPVVCCKRIVTTAALFSGLWGNVANERKMGPPNQSSSAEQSLDYGHPIAELSVRDRARANLWRDTSVSTLMVCAEEDYVPGPISDRILTACREVGVQKQMALQRAEDLSLGELMLHHARKSAFLCDPGELPWQKVPSEYNLRGNYAVIGDYSAALRALMPSGLDTKHYTSATNWKGLKGVVKTAVFHLLVVQMKLIGGATERRAFVEKTVPPVLMEEFISYLKRKGRYPAWENSNGIKKWGVPSKMRECCAVVAAFFAVTISRLLQMEPTAADYIEVWLAEDAEKRKANDDGLGMLRLALMLINKFYSPAQQIVEASTDHGEKDWRSRCQWAKQLRETSVLGDLLTLYSGYARQFFDCRCTETMICDELQEICHQLTNQQSEYAVVDDGELLLEKSMLFNSSDLGSRFYPRCAVRDFSVRLTCSKDKHEQERDFIDYVYLAILGRREIEVQEVDATSKIHAVDGDHGSSAVLGSTVRTDEDDLERSDASHGDNANAQTVRASLQAASLVTEQSNIRGEQADVDSTPVSVPTSEQKGQVSEEQSKKTEHCTPGQEEMEVAVSQEVISTKQVNGHLDAEASSKAPMKTNELINVPPANATNKSSSTIELASNTPTLAVKTDELIDVPPANATNESGTTNELASDAPTVVENGRGRASSPMAYKKDGEDLHLTEQESVAILCLAGMPQAATKDLSVDDDDLRTESINSEGDFPDCNSLGTQRSLTEAAGLLQADSKRTHQDKPKLPTTGATVSVDDITKSLMEDDFGEEWHQQMLQLNFLRDSGRESELAGFVEHTSVLLRGSDSEEQKLKLSFLLNHFHDPKHPLDWDCCLAEVCCASTYKVTGSFCYYCRSPLHAKDDARCESAGVVGRRGYACCPRLPTAGAPARRCRAINAMWQQEQNWGNESISNWPEPVPETDGVSREVGIADAAKSGQSADAKVGTAQSASSPSTSVTPRAGTASGTDQTSPGRTTTTAVATAAAEHSPVRPCQLSSVLLDDAFEVGGGGGVNGEDGSGHGGNDEDGSGW